MTIFFSWSDLLEESVILELFLRVHLVLATFLGERDLTFFLPLPRTALAGDLDGVTGS